MHISEVTTDRQRAEFLEFPPKLYTDTAHWIRPLDKDINAVFSPKENKLFRQGKCTRWIAYDDHGQVVGQLAAFVNGKTFDKTEYRTGGIGFFECIDDRQVAHALFDTAKEWLMLQGMEAMDGPINFGERDKWWGLLVEGFDLEPNYCMHYHHAYYKELFESYGFKNYFEQYTYSFPVHKELPSRVFEKAERVMKDPGYSTKYYKKSEVKAFAQDFVDIYNLAWARHGGVAKMPLSQAESIFKKMNPIVDPDVVVFAYYHHKPIGFFIIIPELNQVFKYLGGKFGLYQKIRFLFLHKIAKKCRKIFGVAFGIIPDFQGKGIEAYLIIQAARKTQPYKRYDDFEMNWIGDFNPKMIHLVEALGSKISKKHITYRYIFDPEKPFSRAKVID